MLPEESLDFIRITAEHMKRRTHNSIHRLVSRLYNYEKSYGFEDNILSGDYSPYPSFHNRSVNCFLDHVEKFFLAEYLGFEPRAYIAYGLRKEKEKIKPDSNRSDLENKVTELVNEDEFDPYQVGHMFIDLKLPNRKMRYVCDNRHNNRGFYEIDWKNKVLKIKERKFGKWKRVLFNQCIEQTKEELIERIKYYRGEEDPEGPIRMIEGGQQTKDFAVGFHRVWQLFKYHPDLNTLEVQLQMPMNCIPDMAVTNMIKLDQNGNKLREMINLATYTDTEWMMLENKQDYGTYSKKSMQSYWNVLRTFRV